MVSDIVIVSVIPVVGGIVTLFVKYWLARLSKKLDSYHTEVNGKITKLLDEKDKNSELQQDISRAEGKAEATAEAKIEIDELNKKIKK